jgi:hypothetical protein
MGGGHVSKITHILYAQFRHCPMPHLLIEVLCNDHSHEFTTVYTNDIPEIMTEFHKMKWSRDYVLTTYLNAGTWGSASFCQDRADVPS